MRTIIEETDKYILYHHVGVTVFKGCQCFKDCSCSDDFTPVSYNNYSVFKKINKPKTTHHLTLENARLRIDFINTLIDTNNPKWRKHDKN
jgi:hypothetical protein